MQTKLQNLSLELSIRCGDEVSDYTADGLTVSADRREAAINHAVGQYYDIKFAEYVAKYSEYDKACHKFGNDYPEFIQKVPYVIVDSVPNSLLLTKDDSVKKYKTCSIEAVEPSINAEASRIKAEVYYRAKLNLSSGFRPSPEHPKFFETDTALEIMIGGERSDDRIINGTVSFICLLRPVKVAFDVNGDDIITADIWNKEVLSIAKNYVFEGRQQ